MFQPIQRASRPAHPLALDRRAAEWLLALLYATLLVAVIWKLDNGDLPRDVTPVPTVADTVARARALMLGFTESLRPSAAAPLSQRQTTPEGWSLWSGGADERTPERAVGAGPIRPAD